MNHALRFLRNIHDSGWRCVCSCGWSAADEDREALAKRARGHDVAHLPDLPKTLPFKSGLPEDIRS